LRHCYRQLHLQSDPRTDESRPNYSFILPFFFPIYSLSPSRPFSLPSFSSFRAGRKKFRISHSLTHLIIRQSFHPTYLFRGRLTLIRPLYGDLEYYGDSSYSTQFHFVQLRSTAFFSFFYGFRLFEKIRFGWVHYGLWVWVSWAG
jgi:hypothetical protein